jgi:hypothetical protein
VLGLIWSIFVNDVALEQAEDAYREQRQKEACLEAARLVAEGMSREQAVRKVADRMSARDDAVRPGAFVADADGDIESFLDSALDSNPLQYGNPAQIKAIALELFAADTFANEV